MAPSVDKKQHYIHIPQKDGKQSLKPTYTTADHL